MVVNKAAPRKYNWTVFVYSAFNRMLNRSICTECLQQPHRLLFMLHFAWTSAWNKDSYRHCLLLYSTCLAVSYEVGIHSIHGKCGIGQIEYLFPVFSFSFWALHFTPKMDGRPCCIIIKPFCQINAARYTCFIQKLKDYYRL